jgi:hypothetical protein
MHPKITHPIKKTLKRKYPSKVTRPKNKLLLNKPSPLAIQRNKKIVKLPA